MPISPGRAFDLLKGISTWEDPVFCGLAVFCGLVGERERNLSDTVVRNDTSHHKSDLNEAQPYR